MIAPSALLALLLAGASAFPPMGREPATKLFVAGGPARSSYLVSFTGPRPALRPHRAHGYTQRVRRLAGRIEVTVLSDPSFLPLAAPWPANPARLPPEPRGYLRDDGESVATPVITALAAELAAGCRYEHEVSERILTWVSTQVSAEEHPQHDDSAAAALGTRRASCVGRSRLSVALLRAAGIPARTVHGLVVPRDTPRGVTLGSASFALHRYVESWLTGAGWMPSDPGESIHIVDTRHLFLSLDDESYDPEAWRGLQLRLVEAGLGALELEIGREIGREPEREIGRKSDGGPAALSLVLRPIGPSRAGSLR